MRQFCRLGRISTELLELLLTNTASSITRCTASRRASSSSIGSTYSSSNSSGSRNDPSTRAARRQALYSQLLTLLDYLQLSSSTAAASSSSSSSSTGTHHGVTAWLPQPVDVLRFLYYCFAAEAVQVMLSYKPHANAAARGFNRPSNAAFVITLDEDQADPSLCVRTLAVKSDLAGHGLRTAASSQVFSSSNSTVLRNLHAVRAEVVAQPGPNVQSRNGCWQSGTVRDVIGKAVGVSHPLCGQALQEALLAGISSGGLGAGFTWVKGLSEAAAAHSTVQLGGVGGGVQAAARMAALPVWVLWW
uniref:Uncharacterized protein n=1 Tax=Tetradesmus obliquus TaxID=3088 RepID=A0A383VVZ9_TETOB|eukprot:jgi/Sobl393_1/16946/SZX69657.1